jgi:hypothetical protein
MGRRAISVLRFAGWFYKSSVDRSPMLEIVKAGLYAF